MPWRSRWSGARLSSTRGVGRERDRVLELERRRLAHDDGGGVERPASVVSAVPTLPATATGMPGLAVDLADELGGRRLAVRAGDRDHVVGQQPPAELELAERRARRARAPRGRPAPPAARPGS